MSYSIGHIYKIICNLDNLFCYIGSTFKSLNERLEKHKNDYKNYNGTISIHKYFDKYGIDNFKIILIKTYNVIRIDENDRKHLEAYETLWICKTINCVNKQLPFNPLKKEQQKKYREENRETIAVKKKEYREKNKETIAEKQKEYRQKNKEILAEKNKEYREKNKETINEKRKKYREKNKETIAVKKKEYREKNNEIINKKQNENYHKNKEKFAEKAKEYREKNNEIIECGCGSKIKKYKLNDHFKSKKHQTYLQNLNNNN